MNGMRTNGSRITPLAVASGAIASFDAQVAAPMKILKAGIDPVQAGSGVPSPSNIRPISGWDEIKITNESGEIFEAANIVASESEIKAYYDADLVLKAGTYVFSTDATDSVTLIGAQYYSGSWVNLFTQIGTSRKFTLSRSGKCHFRAELRGSGDLSSNTVSLKQLDKRTIELPDTVYGGKLDVTNGVLTITRIGHIFNGEESFTTIGNAYLYNFGQRVQSSFSNYSSTECSHFKVGAYAGWTQILPNEYIIAGTYYFGVNPDMTLDNYKVYLTEQANNGTPVVATATLATPIELPIDPISMDTYAGSNKITTDSGNTTACFLKGVTT